MKLLLALIVAFFSLTVTSGQQITVDEILSIKEVKTLIYNPEIVSGKQLFLKMNYGSSTILNAAEINKITDAKIASIDIVYSDHPQGDTFSNLTRSRIENLKRLQPSIFLNRDIKWKLIRQISCVDQNSAKKLFHGIVITYRPAQTKNEVIKEINYLKDILSKLPKGSTESISISKIIRYESEYLGDSARSKDILTGERGYAFSEGVYPTFNDSTVIAVLNRHNWTNMIITADLTGSMSPYTAQLLVWLRLNTTNNKAKQFVFFNDGDMTPDHKKIIGKTGGIYDTRSSKFEDVEKLAFTTMSNGSGGDGPENDIESILKAIELCPECNNIVLIADNWAPIKDISLLSKINKPIKIVLCGADYGINTEYLDLARSTGGSVHTIESDLTELMKLNEGQEIKIRGQTFKIKKGKFVRLI